MKIAIVGAGGIGGYIGAKLLHAKEAEVTVVARGKHLEAIKNHGLLVHDEEEEFRVSGDHFTQTPLQFAPFDVVIFCTKSYDLKEAAWHMVPCVNENTLLFALCNGLGHEKTLAGVFPHNPIATACLYILSNIQSPGVIKKYGGVFLLIAGQIGTPHPHLYQLAMAFKNANMPFKLSDDIALACWKKYLFISVFGTLTAFYDKPIGWLMEHQSDEVRALLHEVVAIANAQGVDVSETHVAQAYEQAQTKVPYGATTSLQLDIRAGNPSEFETLTGYLVTQARNHALSTPTLISLYTGLLQKIKGTLS